jgi:hypothetical protein
MGRHPFGDPRIVKAFARQPVAGDVTDFHVYSVVDWFRAYRRES